MCIRLTSDYAFVDADGVRQEFKSGTEINDADLESFVRRDTQSWEEIESTPSKAGPADEPDKPLSDEPVETAEDLAEPDKPLSDEPAASVVSPDAADSSLEEVSGDAVSVPLVEHELDDLASMSYAALKDKARGLGLVVSGRKADLIARIEAHALRVSESE